MPKHMKSYKIIACRVFEAEFAVVAKDSPHRLDFEYLDVGEHEQPEGLHKKLQRLLDSAAGFDAVLLAYGLCGGATAGLSAPVPLVIPRSHDCCGILLGCRKRFEELFRPMPSAPFASAGFDGHEGVLTGTGVYAAWVLEYGEETAEYLREALTPKLNGRPQPLHFIHTVPVPGLVERCRARAEREGREFLELQGDLRLLAMLLRGEWPEDEFLTLSPGETIRQTGDWSEILRRAPAKIISGG